MHFQIIFGHVGLSYQSKMEKSALGKGKEQDWGMVILTSDPACKEFPVSYLACSGANGTLFSHRCLKLERPSQLEMFSRVICLVLGNKAEEIKIMTIRPQLMNFLPHNPLSWSCFSGTYFVGVLQRKDGKAQDQSHLCSGLDMTKPDSTSSKRFLVLS